jgi:hypothetical protein
LQVINEWGKKCQGQREESTKEHPVEEGHSLRPKEISPQEIRLQSRRCQQRFRARQRKEEAKRLQSLILWEEGRTAHQFAQIERAAVRETRENYGLVPNLTISIHLNAPHVLGKTPKGAYFSHFMNKQFHNLTSSESIPTAAATILGFGLKFIPVPKKSIAKTSLTRQSNASTATSTSKSILLTKNRTMKKRK